MTVGEAQTKGKTHSQGVQDNESVLVRFSREIEPLGLGEIKEVAHATVATGKCEIHGGTSRLETHNAV